MRFAAEAFATLLALVALSIAIATAAAVYVNVLCLWG